MLTNSKSESVKIKFLSVSVDYFGYVWCFLSVNTRSKSWGCKDQYNTLFEHHGYLNEVFYEWRNKFTAVMKYLHFRGICERKAANWSWWSCNIYLAQTYGAREKECKRTNLANILLKSARYFFWTKLCKLSFGFVRKYPEDLWRL